jgi:hypothetical protein
VDPDVESLLRHPLRGARAAGAAGSGAIAADRYLYHDSTGIYLSSNGVDWQPVDLP